MTFYITWKGYPHWCHRPKLPQEVGKLSFSSEVEYWPISTTLFSRISHDVRRYPTQRWRKQKEADLDSWTKHWGQQAFPYFTDLFQTNWTAASHSHHFQGTGTSNYRSWKEIFEPWHRCLFPKNAWGNAMFFLEWVEETRKPFVNKDTGKFILFFDNFSGYVYCNFRDVVKALGGLAWFGDHRATDIW